MTCHMSHVTSDFFKTKMTEKSQKVATNATTTKIPESAQKCRIVSKGQDFIVSCCYRHTARELVSPVCGIFISGFGWAGI